MSRERDERTVMFRGVRVEATTAKAVLLEIEGEKHWCPLSLVNYEECEITFKRDEEGDVSVARWWAVKEGLVEE